MFTKEEEEEFKTTFQAIKKAEEMIFNQYLEGFGLEIEEILNQNLTQLANSLIIVNDALHSSSGFPGMVFGLEGTIFEPTMTAPLLRRKKLITERIIALGGRSSAENIITLVENLSEQQIQIITETYVAGNQINRHSGTVKRGIKMNDNKIEIKGSNGGFCH